MDFARYKKATQREYVILALDLALRSISGPTPTIEIVEHVQRTLAAKADQKVSIGRILGEMAPHVPEARRGAVFKAYGRTMQRWVWWPKGTLPTGGATRQAKRDQGVESFLAEVEASDTEVWSA